jgi:hypothetical protein
MSTLKGLPVAGYTDQTPANVARVNKLKFAEERFLRLLDDMLPDPAFDHRFVSLARTHLQMATMFAGRAVFQPQRVALPEDGE